MQLALKDIKAMKQEINSFNKYCKYMKQLKAKKHLLTKETYEDTESKIKKYLAQVIFNIQAYGLALGQSDEQGWQESANDLSNFIANK